MDTRSSLPAFFLPRAYLLTGAILASQCGTTTYHAAGPSFYGKQQEEPFEKGPNVVQIRGERSAGPEHTGGIRGSEHRLNEVDVLQGGVFQRAQEVTSSLPSTLTSPVSSWKKLGYAALGIACLAGRTTAQFSKNLFTTIDFPGYELSNIAVANISDSIYKAYVGTLYNPTSNLEQGLVFVGTDDGNVSWYDTLAVNTSLLQVEIQDDIIIAGGNTDQSLTGLEGPNMVLYRNVVSGASPAVFMGGTGNYTRFCHFKLASNGNLGVVGTSMAPDSADQYAYLALFDGEADDLPFLAGRKKAIGQLGCDNTVVEVSSAGDFVVNFKSQEMVGNDTYVAYMAQLNPSTSEVEAYRFVQGLPGALDIGFKLTSMRTDNLGGYLVSGYSGNDTFIVHNYDDQYGLTKQSSFVSTEASSSLKLHLVSQPSTGNEFFFVGEYNDAGFMIQYDPPLVGIRASHQLILSGSSSIASLVFDNSGVSASYYGINDGKLIILSLLAGVLGEEINPFESPESCAGILDDLERFPKTERIPPSFSNSGLQTSGDFGALTFFDSIEWPAGLASTTIDFVAEAICGSTDAPTVSPTPIPTNLPSLPPTRSPVTPPQKSSTVDDVLSVAIPTIGVLGSLAIVTLLVLNRLDAKKKVKKKPATIPSTTTSPSSTGNATASDEH